MSGVAYGVTEEGYQWHGIVPPHASHGRVEVRLGDSYPGGGEQVDVSRWLWRVYGWYGVAPGVVVIYGDARVSDAGVGL